MRVLGSVRFKFAALRLSLVQSHTGMAPGERVPIATISCQEYAAPLTLTSESLNPAGFNSEVLSSGPPGKGVSQFLIWGSTF